jgi:hypothetical protein
MKAVNFAIALALSFLLSGCATTSETTNHKFVAGQKTVFVSDNYTGEAGRHVGEVIRTLEKYGFEISNDRDKSDYYLDFSIEGGGVITVEIALLKDYKPVVKVYSSNTGWGTIVARTSAVASRVDSALDEFDEALAKLIVR